VVEGDKEEVTLLIQESLEDRVVVEQGMFNLLEEQEILLLLVLLKEIMEVEILLLVLVIFTEVLGEVEQLLRQQL
tara:strand:- start:319 stop:543 length:225 start_codon:yes stop_codon:yes gene_type:complete